MTHVEVAGVMNDMADEFLAFRVVWVSLACNQDLNRPLGVTQNLPQAGAVAKQ